MAESREQAIMRIAQRLFRKELSAMMSQDIANALMDAYDAGVKAQAEYRESQYQEIIAKSEEREAELHRLRAEVQAIREGTSGRIQ